MDYSIFNVKMLSFAARVYTQGKGVGWVIAGRKREGGWGGIGRKGEKGRGWGAGD